MAFDQFGNYIPDEFGGQPIAPPPMNPSMNAAMNPQMAGAANAPAPNMTPVAAPQRPSIAPMGMPQAGPMATPEPFPAASVASKLREGAVDKDGNPVSFGDQIANKWDKSMNNFEKIGNKFGNAYNWLDKNVGGLFD